MTNEEASIIIGNIPINGDGCYSIPEYQQAKAMAIKALEQQPTAINEIPKDYKYDTETKDFLVYRHKYTGDEIHIKKPIPLYMLEQQPCEDYISRQAVMYALCDACELFHKNGEETCLTKCESYHFLATLPSVTPKEKTGKWIMEDMFDGDVAYRCSECNELFWIESGTPKDNEYNFCPNCGARMVIE